LTLGISPSSTASFISLPEVTETDLKEFALELIIGRRSLEPTSIKNPIPAFKIDEAVVSVGFYKTVMGEYPDPLACYDDLEAEEADEMLAEWKKNPELPAVCIQKNKRETFVDKCQNKYKT
jgi:hypothetical protein